MPQIAIGAAAGAGAGLTAGQLAATMAQPALNSIPEPAAVVFQIFDEFARLAKLFPQIEHAAPPVRAAIGVGAADPFDELEHQVEAGIFRLRSGVTDSKAANLIGPIICHGSSMGKVLPHGSFVWFDPTEPADAGDIVMFRYADAWLRELMQSAQMHDEKFRRTYQGWAPNVGIKFLGHHKARHVLYADDALPLRLEDGHRLMGVVRHVVDAHGDALYL